MKIKIDENLPAECAGMFGDAGFEAETVLQEGLSGADDALIAAKSRAEGRVLVTLDLDFANIGAYRPAEYAGIVVLRLKRQDKHTVLAVMQRIAVTLMSRVPTGELWIVELDRIRFRIA